MARNYKNPTEKAYFDKRKALLKRINRAIKAGIQGVKQIPKIPKEITEGSIRNLEKIGKGLLKKSYLVTDEGKVLKGEKEISKFRHREAGLKAAQTAKENKLKRVQEFKEKVEKATEDIVDLTEPGEMPDQYQWTDTDAFDNEDLDDEIIYMPPAPSFGEESEDEEDEEKTSKSKPNDGLSYSPEEYLESLEQVKEYIEELEPSNPANAARNDKRKLYLFRLINAAERENDVGLAYRLHEAAENGDLKELLDTGIDGSDRESEVALSELEVLISGRAMTPEESRMIHDLQVELRGYDPAEYD